MKMSTVATIVIQLFLFVIEPTDVCVNSVRTLALRILRAIQQNLTQNNTVNNIDTMQGNQNIIPQQNLIRDIPMQTTGIVQDTISRDPNLRSMFVDGTILDFVYWNSELGNNNPVIIEFGNEKQIMNNWLRGKPLKVITHGWLGSDTNDNGVFAIKTAYVTTGGYNVITADWNRVASNIMYPMPAYLTAEVGSIIAILLENLVNLALIDPADIHIIGHSLGAHVSGACGAAFSLGKIGRITGLDPAGPGFEYIAMRSDRLDITDAVFVDVIHTAIRTFGYSNSIGHADFFPNNGKPPQPGCLEPSISSELSTLFACSHSRSHQLFADSVYYKNSFIAVMCPSWKEYLSGVCKNNFISPMGHDAGPKARGNFYLKTNAMRPFGISNTISQRLS